MTELGLPPPLAISQGSHTVGKQAGGETREMEDTLKCPICLDLFEDPVSLDCTHCLCLKCARSLVLHDGGTNTPEVTCPLCKEVTSVGGGDEARELEDVLIASALKRFDIVPPRKGRVRIEDLKGCYEAFTRKGLVDVQDEPKPTALHVWRATVAKMESQVQERLGEKMDVVPTTTAGHKGEDVGEGLPSSPSPGPEEMEVTSEGGDPMLKLRFKPNHMLQSVVTLLRQQKAAAAAAAGGGGGGGVGPIVTTTDIPSRASPPTYPTDLTAPAALPLPTKEEVGVGGTTTATGSPQELHYLHPASSPTQADHAALSYPHLQHQQQQQQQYYPYPPYPQATDATAIPSHQQPPLEPVTTATPMMMSDDMPTPVSPSGGSTTAAAIDPSSSSQGHADAADGGPVPEFSQHQLKQGSGDDGTHQGSRHLWAGNLYTNVDEAELRQAFTAFGPLEALRLLHRSYNQVLGFVHFARTEDAMACKEALNGVTNHLGSYIKIQYQERGNNGRCATLRVHNIAPQATEADLQRIFSKYGKMRSVHINTKTYIGFVSFETEEQATEALSKVHDTEVMGHHVFMDYAARDKEGRGGRDGGGRDGHPQQRGGGPPPSRYNDGGDRGGGGRDDRGRDDRGRGGGGGGGGDRSPRLIVLSSPRGCPPFEVFGEDNLAQLRELVDLIQFHLPASQRQSLEEALQNRDLYDNIQQLVGRNRRDLSGPLQTLRAELGLPRRAPQSERDRGAGGGGGGGYRGGGGYEGGYNEGRGGPRGGPSPRDRDRPGDYGGGAGDRGYERGRDQGPPPPRHDDRGHGAYDQRGSRPVPPHDSRGPPSYDNRPPPGGYRRDDRDRSRSRDQYGGGGREVDSYRAGGAGGEPVGGGRYGPASGRGGDDVYGGARDRGPPPSVPPSGGDQRWDAGARRRSRSRSPGRKRARPADYGGGRYEAVPPRSRSRSPQRRRPEPVPSRDVFPAYGSTVAPNAPHAYPHPTLPVPPPRRIAPAPLEAECDQFLQAIMGTTPAQPVAVSHVHAPAPYPIAAYGGVGGYGAPAPLPLPPPPPVHNRMWLTSAQAASYPCYEGVLAMVKDILMPFYRDQRISKEDFKRNAEETTLKIVQQLVDVGLESRPDVPHHYRQVAFDAIRAALKI